MRKANHASHIYTATTAATEYFQSQTSTENLQLSMGEKNGAGHMPAQKRNNPGPTTAAILRPQFFRKARKPTTEYPRLANPISVWNGLFGQPMKSAVISPKNECRMKL
jgi:hypothetical protein